MKSIFNFLGFVAIIMSITLISCEKDDSDVSNNKCNVTNPAEEIAWLKEAIDEIKQDEYSYYVMTTYKGVTI